MIRSTVCEHAYDHMNQVFVLVYDTIKCTVRVCLIILKSRSSTESSALLLVLIDVCRKVLMVDLCLSLLLCSGFRFLRSDHPRAE